MPFGGAYRLIDFVLSNLVNAGYERICVLTQYSRTPSTGISRRPGGVRATANTSPVPAAAARAALIHWQRRRHFPVDEPDRRREARVHRGFGADHVYRMDPSQMVARISAAVPTSRSPASGCRARRRSPRLHRRRRLGPHHPLPEKPRTRPAHPTIRTSRLFASMGNYVFTTDALVQALRADAADSDSDHDMGGDIIPAFVAGHRIRLRLQGQRRPGATERDKGYWRDVGTLDAFYDAHMDLVSVHPVFNLYNRRWPIRGESLNLPPAKFVEAGTPKFGGRCGLHHLGATVTRSVLSSDVFIEAGAVVEDSVLMPGVRVGKARWCARPFSTRTW